MAMPSIAWRFRNICDHRCRRRVCRVATAPPKVLN